MALLICSDNTSISTSTATAAAYYKNKKQTPNVRVLEVATLGT